MEIPVRCRVMEQEPVTAVMSGYDRPDDCPITEVPPHGRLIDADALPIKDEWAYVGTNAIWDAPTVLEATE